MHREQERRMSTALITCAVCGHPVEPDTAHFIDGDGFGAAGQVEVHPDCCPDCGNAEPIGALAAELHEVGPMLASAVGPPSSGSASATACIQFASEGSTGQRSYSRCPMYRSS